jgi:hypothetical protein
MSANHLTQCSVTADYFSASQEINLNDVFVQKTIVELSTVQFY